MKNNWRHILKDRLKPFIRRILYYLTVCRDKRVFLNYDGKGYGDYSEYIVEEILRRNLPYKLVWLVMPIADVVSNLLRLAIQFGFFVVVYAVYALVDPDCTPHPSLKPSNTVFLAPATFYDGAPGLGHRGVQQGAEELYGYGVRKLQYGESKCHSSCFQ